MVEARDTRMDMKTAEARRDRADWASQARPQARVDALAASFAAAEGVPAGVADNGDTQSRGVPIISMKQQ